MHIHGIPHTFEWIGLFYRPALCEWLGRSHASIYLNIMDAPLCRMDSRFEVRVVIAPVSLSLLNKSALPGIYRRFVLGFLEVSHKLLIYFIISGRRIFPRPARGLCEVQLITLYHAEWGNPIISIGQRPQQALGKLVFLYVFRTI